MVKDKLPEYFNNVDHKKGPWRRKVCRKTMNAPKRTNKKRTDPNDSERAVKKECLELLNQLNIPAWRTQSGLVNLGDRRVHLAPAGTSDIVGILPSGIILCIECKRRDGKGIQSDNQKKFQEIVEKYNGVYLLSCSAVELYKQLQEFI